MNKQIEALKLADELERWLLVDAPTRVGVAAELRRLHEVNRELMRALKEITYAAECVETGRHGDCDIDYASWFAKARAAIAKAEGENV